MSSRRDDHLARRPPLVVMVGCILAFAACTGRANGAATVATVEGGTSALRDADGWALPVSTEGATEADLMLHVPTGELACTGGTEPDPGDIAPGQDVTYQRIDDDVMDSDPPGVDANGVVIDC